MSDKTDDPIDWIIVLKLNEIPSYLNQKDLFELSKASIKLRLNLKHLILSNLYYSKSNQNQLKFMLNWDIYDYYSVYKEVLNNINSLVIRYQLASSKLSNLIDKFNNIKLLYLCNLDIQLSNINLILTKLKFLEGLELSKVHINIDRANGAAIDKVELQVSSSLMGLILNSCSTTIYNSQQIYTKGSVRSHIAQCPFLNLSKNTLPNLQSLTVMDMDYEDDHLLNNFLLINPQLISLKADPSELNQSSYDLISNGLQLTLLKLKSKYAIPSFEDILLEPCSSVIQLSLKSVSCWKYIKKISLIFKNIEKLEISYSSKYLKEVLISFLLLKNLTIINNNNNIRISSGNQFNFELPTVTRLTLIKFDPLKVELNNFNNWPLLTRVSIKTSIIPPQSQLDSHFNKFENWRTIAYFDSIQCFKLK
jgi:hypothetical protein